MKRVATWIAVVVLALALLSVFGYYSQKTVDEKNQSVISKALGNFISFPEKVSEVIVSNEVRGIPPTFRPRLEFEPINELTKDVYGLNSFYIRDSNHWEMRLFNFRTDSIDHKWILNSDRFVAEVKHFANSEPRNCILLTNRELILAQDETTNIYKLDRNSNIIWERHDVPIHHSMNLDSDSNIVACSTQRIHFKAPNKKEVVYYEDEVILKLNKETGKTVYEKSVTALLTENNFRSLIYGFSGDVMAENLKDPLHLNDIQPVLIDGPYWKKDDLFLSFRHLSMIILYRPRTNKIVRLVYGPFLRQHDVDIISDSAISIFNNEGTAIGGKIWEALEISDLNIDLVENSSIIQYNFSDSSFTSPLEHHFDKERIFTETQGFHDFLSDGSAYVENYDAGVVYFMNDNEILYKNHLNNRIGDWIERPHWIRIYENVDF